MVWGLLRRNATFSREGASKGEHEKKMGSKHGKLANGRNCGASNSRYLGETLCRRGGDQCVREYLTTTTYYWGNIDKELIDTFVLLDIRGMMKNLQNSKIALGTILKQGGVSWERKRAPEEEKEDGSHSTRRLSIRMDRNTTSRNFLFRGGGVREKRPAGSQSQKEFEEQIGEIS